VFNGLPGVLVKSRVLIDLLLQMNIVRANLHL
jgi:hypothetical protein